MLAPMPASEARNARSMVGSSLVGSLALRCGSSQSQMAPLVETVPSARTGQMRYTSATSPVASRLEYEPSASFDGRDMNVWRISLPSKRATTGLAVEVIAVLAARSASAIEGDSCEWAQLSLAMSYNTWAAGLQGLGESQ